MKPTLISLLLLCSALARGSALADDLLKINGDYKDLTGLHRVNFDVKMDALSSVLWLDPDDGKTEEALNKRIASTFEDLGLLIDSQAPTTIKLEISTPPETVTTRVALRVLEDMVLVRDSARHSMPAVWEAHGSCRGNAYPELVNSLLHAFAAQYKKSQGIADDVNEIPKIVVDAWFTTPNRDGFAQLVVRAQIPPGCWIYPLNYTSGNFEHTTMRLTLSQDYRVELAPCAVTPPQKTTVSDMAMEIHDGDVTWCALIQIAPNVDPTNMRITGSLGIQMNGSGLCYLPADYSFEAILDHDEKDIGPSLPEPPVLPPDNGVYHLPDTPVPASEIDPNA